MATMNSLKYSQKRAFSFLKITLESFLLLIVALVLVAIVAWDPIKTPYALVPIGMFLIFFILPLLTILYNYTRFSTGVEVRIDRLAKCVHAIRGENSVKLPFESITAVTLYVGSSVFRKENPTPEDDEFYYFIVESKEQRPLIITCLMTDLTSLEIGGILQGVHSSGPLRYIKGQRDQYLNFSHPFVENTS